MKKNLLSQRGAFLHWKFLEKSSSGWLQLVFRFGIENGQEQLKQAQKLVQVDALEILCNTL